MKLLFAMLRSLIAGGKEDFAGPVGRRFMLMALASSFSATLIPGQSAEALRVREAVEKALANRVSTGFSQFARPEFEFASSGIAAVDTLTGGFPRGALTELCGPASSGRTTVLIAALVEATSNGESCCLIDVSDSFHPRTAAAAGVDLQRVLWVRCGKVRKCGSAEVRNCVSPRRRGDAEEIQNSRVGIQNERAVAGIQKAKVKNQKWSNGQRPMANGCEQFSNSARSGGQFGSSTGFAAVEQALKIADLVLQGGGFGLVAIDLADVPVRIARRVPLTSWFRFQRAVEKTRTVLLVLEQEPHASSCASLVLQLKGKRSAVSGEQAAPSHGRLLDGFEITAEALRTPGRKQPKTAGADFRVYPEWNLG